MTVEDRHPDLVLLARIDDVPDHGLVVTYPDGPFEESAILVARGGEIRAWKNRCRHLAVRLDRHDAGTVASRDGQWLVCQEHGARYRPDTGECVAGPCVGSSLRPLEIVIRDGAVFLDPARAASFLNPAG